MSKEKKGWFSRLTQGLKKSSNKLSEGITTLLTHKKLDDEALEELEDFLITCDLGVNVSQELTSNIRKKSFPSNVSNKEVKRAFAEEIEKYLTKLATPLLPKSKEKPFIVLVVGVNGSGKTTTIGKLAKQWKDQGYTVSLIAGDTFRAAAIEQLQTWAERVDVPIETASQGADAAGLIYDSAQKAKKRGDDIVLIDTAGRLQNKAHLMDELKKIRRVIQKVDPTAPQSTLLVLDATTGQNAVSQVEVFEEAAQINGIAMTKLDSTAKGGVLIAIAQKFKLPIHFIGIGEKIDDLHPFSAKDFAYSLMGITIKKK